MRNHRLSSEYRFRRKRLLKYFTRRLETRFNNQLDRLWITILVFGTYSMTDVINCVVDCQLIHCPFLQEPNPEDPLNKEAAEVLQNNRRLFEQNVQKAMRGGYVGQVFFEKCLK